MFKKIALLVLFSLFLNNTNASYTEVDCSTNSSFGEYNCDQCFNGGELKVGDNLTFLDDVWVNNSNNSKIMYKEEQTMPVMHSLNGSLFTKNPNNDSFWEYTDEFEALNNEEFDGYVLGPGKQVSWIKSSLGASYKVDNLPPKGQNAGMLVFEIMSHNILESGEVQMSNKSHKECVLYTSAKEDEVIPPVIKENPIVEKEVTPPPTPKEMTKVPTGPELYFLILILSFLLGLGFINRKVILEKIKK